MKRIVPAIVAASLGMSLVAQSTGTLQGGVVDSKGKPIPGAKIVISRIGISWVKEIQPNAEGKFFQVGFTPAEYKITVSAKGFLDTWEEGRIGLGITQKEFVLLTPEEAVKSGKAAVSSDPSASAEAAGLDSFNQAVGFYNDKNYSAALPLFESAIGNLNESIAKATSDTAKVEIEQKIQTVQRPYAFALVEVGKSDAALRVELFSKAEPILVKSLELNPKDQNILVNLLEIATAKKDAEGAQKYQKALDAILGPRPELAYNQGVELYNSGKLAEAKPFFLKSISVKADFADAYYLLAMCEFSENNLKGTKTNLQKYIDLSPAGKHAAEVKAMLSDPSLKNIK